jgi:hypothetical protein
LRSALTLSGSEVEHGDGVAGVDLEHAAARGDRGVELLLLVVDRREGQRHLRVVRVRAGELLQDSGGLVQASGILQGLRRLQLLERVDPVLGIRQGTGAQLRRAAVGAGAHVAESPQALERLRIDLARLRLAAGADYVHGFELGIQRGGDA